MARLFITAKEIQLINDLTKEFIKDVVGQTILYYPISTLKTKIHEVYEEAVQKIFENPIKLDVLVGQPEWETRHNIFGAEQSAKFEVLIQARELIDKGMTINEGDFFVYGGAVFEIQSYLNMNNIFGQEEYDCAFKIVGRLARPGTFDPKYFAAKDAKEFVDSAGDKDFVQQRGLPENVEGQTGDVRQVRERLKDTDEMAEVALGDGPRKVAVDETAKANTFYDE
jgi:hypothetical protein